MAGVSISLVFNSDGLFSKANEAASRYNQAKENELAFLQGADEYFDRYNGVFGGSGTPIPSGTVTPTVPEAGWTIEEAKELVERDGLKDHLGEKVQYSPTGGGTWRIFYYDNENDGNGNGYFGELNTLYLKRDYETMDTILAGYQSYTPTDGGVIMRKMNPLWAISNNASLIDLVNEHCVSWLCDPAIWNVNYKVEGIVDYAIGSPSVEMYMKAFNIYKEDGMALINKIGNTYGYSVGANGSYTWNNSNESYTGRGAIEEGPNNIFMTSGDNNNNNCWWLASPSSMTENAIIFIPGNTAEVSAAVSMDSSGYRPQYGICPIVAISNN